MVGVLPAGWACLTIGGRATPSEPPDAHESPMDPTNLLILMSDEHNLKFLGGAGHPFIATPNLDALTAGGTRFSQAYTTWP